MTEVRDPRLDLPEDIQSIAESLPPAGRGMAYLRQLIGILPDPLRSTQPRLADEGAQEPADPQARLNSGIGSQTGVLGTQTVTGAIPGSALMPGTVSGGAIAADSITGNHIQANTITSNEIQANSITSNHIQSNAVTTDELAANSVTADELAANSVQAGDIVAGTVTANEIATAAVTGVELADGSVSDVHISGLSADKITTGTLDAITITACNISCGGGGFDGFQVLNASNSVVGDWDSTVFYCDPAATFNESLYVSGYLNATNTGVGTRVVAGAFSNVAPNDDGQLGIDSSNGRFYFRYGGTWHYTAQTAGFEIPSWEQTCPACGLELKVDDPVIGRITDIKPDGARHALYVHFTTCVTTPLDPVLVQKALEGAPSAPVVDPYEPVEEVDPAAIKEEAQRKYETRLADEQAKYAAEQQTEQEARAAALAADRAAKEEAASEAG